jgi:hypothetical protein
MQVFISHNVANKADARLLASALVRRGSNVWFDEWSIRPGESITNGIESGLSSSDIFVLIWGAEAANSNWVGTEVRAYLHRRVADASLRIVPIMIDETPLPLLVADYLGFKISAPEHFDMVAYKLSGQMDDQELAQQLQERLWELAKDKVPEGSPHRYLICPQCGSADLKHSAIFDNYKERINYAVMCLGENCKFMRSQFGA